MRSNNYTEFGQAFLTVETESEHLVSLADDLRKEDEAAFAEVKVWVLTTGESI